MKRVITFVMILLTILCVLIGIIVARGGLNAPLRNKMVDYYSKNESYSVLQGKVSSVKIQEDIREIHIMVDILTPGHDFPLIPRTNLGEFVIVDYTVEETSISVGDEIEFTSAPMYFYNGHDLPVVSLRIGDTEILSFEEGKERYLSWVKHTFD
jgi:hypothetical protein